MEREGITCPHCGGQVYPYVGTCAAQFTPDFTKAYPIRDTKLITGYSKPINTGEEYVEGEYVVDYYGQRIRMLR